MPVHEKLVDELNEVDVIIAGGGTAACMVAGRLAAADPNLSILLIEGGADNYNVENIVNPVLFLEHLLPDSKTAIFYKGNKSEALAGREPIVPCGGTLGGGSSINFMMYTRAQRSDFDSWKTEGWTADEILPYLKSLETYHGPGNSDVHGYDGPIHVSDGGFRGTASMEDFIAAAGKVGYQDTRDLQSLDENNKYERWLRYVSPEGKRQDTAHTYLHPLLQDGKHPNLHVLVKSKVLRILFDGQKRAVGVEYTPNPHYQAEIGLTAHPTITVKARRQVVLSCGACGSPSVLERSGLGSSEVLQKAGVEQIADIPGVGHDYQDHHLILYPYHTSLKPEETTDAYLSGRVPRDEFIASRAGPMLGWNTIDVCSKIRPTDAHIAALGPEFQAAWDKDFKNDPNRPLMLNGVVNSYLGDQSTVPPGQYVSVANYTAYPYSRGHIHITGPRLDDELDFDLGFFTDAHDIDLKKHVWAYKHQREVMRRTHMYRGELALGHPKFPEGSDAACGPQDGPAGAAAAAVADIKYTAEDDRAIEQFVRENINTTWHSLGTNKMAPLEQNGVVDKHLNVHGVEGLKIVDLSIAPENVGANTNNTALVIGEKGADILLKELGLVK